MDRPTRLQLLSLWSTCRLFQILGLAELLFIEATKYDIAALRHTVATPFCDDNTNRIRDSTSRCGASCVGGSGKYYQSIIKTLFTGLYNGATNIRGPVRGALELLACSRAPVKPARRPAVGRPSCSSASKTRIFTAT